MQPLRDPLKNLITVASDRVVRDVYVNGRQVVANGEVLTIDLPANLALLAEAQAQMMAAVPKKDWGGRTIDEISPLSFPLVESLGAATAE
jgi:5-methylthioadenosine/S-adenosylhomocysteine deaminase